MKAITVFRMILFGAIIYVTQIIASVCIILVVLCTLIFVVSGGCRSETSYYKPNWKAKDYFEDSKEIALCKAINRSDIAEIDRLIDGGVDVNKKGKGGMTFLLWAYPTGETSFKRILEHGGDPNVVYERDFGYRTNDHKLQPGDTLIFLVINSTRGPRSRYTKYKKQFENYIQLLIDHGANIDFQRKHMNHTPLHWATFCHNRQAIRQLVEAGADLNLQESTVGGTPLMSAPIPCLETILLLLEAGTDYRIVGRYNQTIAHVVARYATIPAQHTPQNQVYYDKVVAWLADRGISVQRAGAQTLAWETRATAGRQLSLKEIYRDDIPEGSQAPPPGPSTLTKEQWDEYVNNAP